MNASRRRWVWVALALLAWVRPLPAQELAPNPSLTPEQVVQLQIDALRHNDTPIRDAGIERSFRFASPSNKSATGPLAHFTEIVRSPAYSPLLNSTAASVAESEVNGDEAKVVVQIVSGTGNAISYLFLLSKQKEGEF